MTTTEYLLDTNACIAIRQLLADKLSKNPDRRRAIAALRQRWLQAGAQTLAMSLITLGELEFGASKSQATGRTVVTPNVSEFGRAPGLRTENWTA